MFGYQIKIRFSNINKSIIQLSVETVKQLLSIKLAAHAGNAPASPEWESGGLLLSEYARLQPRRELNSQIPPWKGGDYNQFVYWAIYEIGVNEIGDIWGNWTHIKSVLQTDPYASIG